MRKKVALTTTYIVAVLLLLSCTSPVPGELQFEPNPGVVDKVRMLGGNAWRCESDLMGNWRRLAYDLPNASKHQVVTEMGKEVWKGKAGVHYYLWTGATARRRVLYFLVPGRFGEEKEIDCEEYPAGHCYRFQEAHLRVPPADAFPIAWRWRDDPDWLQAAFGGWWPAPEEFERQLRAGNELWLEHELVHTGKKIYKVSLQGFSAALDLCDTVSPAVSQRGVRIQ